jgi:hypothetical protein
MDINLLEQDGRHIPADRGLLGRLQERLWCWTYAALKRRIASEELVAASRRIGRILDSGVDIDDRRHYF